MTCFQFSALLKAHRAKLWTQSNEWMNKNRSSIQNRKWFDTFDRAHVNEMKCETEKCFFFFSMFTKLFAFFASMRAICVHTEEAVHIKGSRCHRHLWNEWLAPHMTVSAQKAKTIHRSSLNIWRKRNLWLIFFFFFCGFLRRCSE